MPIHYDYEADTLYQRGEEKGRAEERKENIIKFWQKGIDLPMIANLMDMPIEQVEHIIAQFQKDKKEFVQKVKSDLTKEKP